MRADLRGCTLKAVGRGGPERRAIADIFDIAGTCDGVRYARLGSTSATSRITTQLARAVGQSRLRPPGQPLHQPTAHLLAVASTARIAGGPDPQRRSPCGHGGGTLPGPLERGTDPLGSSRT